MPTSAQRLAVAREALARAELQAGVRRRDELSARQACEHVLNSSTPPRLSPSSSHTAHSQVEKLGTKSSREHPWADLLRLSIPGWGGVIAIEGSTTLSLALAGARQGNEGWCAILGSDDVGWCAAQRLGLRVEHTLAIPLDGLDEALLASRLPAVLSALLESMEVIVLSHTAASLLGGRLRRMLLSQARQRGVMVISGLAWQGIRRWEVTPQIADAARAPQPAELPQGYVSVLQWGIEDPRRGLQGQVFCGAQAPGLEAPSGVVAPAAGAPVACAVPDSEETGPLSPVLPLRPEPSHVEAA